MSIAIVISSDYTEYELPVDILTRYLQQYSILNDLPVPRQDKIYEFDYNSISRTDPLLVSIVKEFIKHRVQTNLHKISSAKMLDVVTIPDYMRDYYTIQNANGKEHVILSTEKYKNETFRKIMTSNNMSNDTKFKLVRKLRQHEIKTQSFINICENLQTTV